MTTRRENMLKVMRHEVPDWIPITGHCDPYNKPSPEGMDPELAEALGEVQWNDTSTTILSRYLGLTVLDMFGLPSKITRRNVVLDSKCENDVITNTWHTPEGDLHEVIRICREDSGAVSSNHTEHMVKGPEDLPAFTAIFEDQVVEPDPEGIARVRERRELIGEDGIILGVMAGTPLGMMYREFSGVGALAYLWADAPDALRDCFDVIEGKYLEQIAVGIEAEFDILVGMDDTSTTAISPTMFEQYNMELTDARVEAAHAAGKLYYHHSCGLIRDLLPLYRQTKIDGVHAFTIPPIGDVTIAEGRKALGENMTIMAGLQQLPGPMHDRAAVRESIHAMIAEAGAGKDFAILTAGYPNRTIDQMRFVIDCCREVGGTPE